MVNFKTEDGTVHLQAELSDGHRLAGYDETRCGLELITNRAWRKNLWNYPVADVVAVPATCLLCLGNLE